jgi:hypothetical protein
MSEAVKYYRDEDDFYHDHFQCLVCSKIKLNGDGIDVDGLEKVLKEYSINHLGLDKRDDVCFDCLDDVKCSIMKEQDQPRR